MSRYYSEPSSFRNRRYSKPLRVRCNLSTQDVARLFDDLPEVARAFSPGEQNIYNRYAMRNEPIADLAVYLGNSVEAAQVYLTDLENQIVMQYLFACPHVLPNFERRPLIGSRDDLQAALDSIDAAQDAAILQSGGKEIGGHIAKTRGESFDRGCQWTDDGADFDGGSGLEDDYGDESSA